REVDPSLPEELDRIVRRALSREREARYQWAFELQDALNQYLYSTGELAGARDLATWMAELFGGPGAETAGPVPIATAATVRAAPQAAAPTRKLATPAREEPPYRPKPAEVDPSLRPTIALPPAPRGPPPPAPPA